MGIGIGTRKRRQALEVGSCNLYVARATILTQKWVRADAGTPR